MGSRTFRAKETIGCIRSDGIMAMMQPEAERTKIGTHHASRLTRVPSRDTKRLPCE